MSEATFFVKIRGRVLGPFPSKRLTQMVRQGDLSRIHQLSSDGKSWQPASAYPELFSVATAPPVQSPNASSPREKASKPAGVSSPMLADDRDDNQEQWYYGINDQSTGPVSTSTLERLLSSGQLATSDKLWHSGMDDWQSVSEFPEFASIVAEGNRASMPSINIDSGREGSGGSVGNDKAGAIDTAAVSRLVSKANPWIYLCFIVLYFIVAGGVFSAIFAAIKGVQLQNTNLIVQAFFMTVYAGLLGAAAVCLNRYATAISRFIVSGNGNDFQRATRHLGLFWMWTGTWLALLIVIAVASILYVYTVLGA